MGVRRVKRPRSIPLSKSKTTWVSAARYETVMTASPWYAAKHGNTWYAERAVKLGSGKRTLQRMHEFITGYLPTTDHIDGNGLNNCDYNLRPATQAQQIYNRPPFKGGSSKYKGVSKVPWGKWRARIQSEDVPEYTIGYFDDELDAARAYDAAAIELHAEFAWLNTDHFGRANGSADELQDYWHWRGRPICPGCGTRTDSYKHRIACRPH